LPTETTETDTPTDAPTENCKKPKGPERGNRCLNCGREPLNTAFCPDCGQEDISYAVTLPVLLRDVIDEFLKFDGRLFRTLGALLLKPGKFTEEYNAGRRVHYLSPFKLYLVVSAAFFYLMALQAPTREIERSVHEGMRPGSPDSVLKVKVGGAPLVPLDYKVKGQPLRPGNYADAYEAWQKDPKNPKKQTGVERFAARQILRFLDHPGALVGHYIESSAKAMFFMVPLYGLFLAGLFRGARRFYVEHLVFAINQHTVAFIYSIGVTLIRRDAPLLFFGYFVIYWLYEFLALRRIYHQPIGLTLFKQFVLNNFYIGALLIAMLVVIVVAVALL
jgi:hypothetical protein